MSHLRVLIADDDSRVRRCLRTLLDQQSDIEVVGEACGGNELVDAVLALKPDRVLVDVKMPGSGGLELVRRIKNINPEVCVVVLSVYADQLTEALRAGAGHYLLKGCPIEDLLRALRRPCCDRTRFSAALEPHAAHAGAPLDVQGVS
ncbi:MAG: response regulator transcription factor [Chloroflexi bacterium]|nr:response regulator transcription factor [Chloroflexota bacterium]